MTPRVSIVVPTYNNGSVLSHTLDSILVQTYSDFELIIADHSSTDDTLEVAQRYAATDSRIQVVTTPAGGGAVRNWNRACDLAQGEFLKLVCGDDLLYPSIVARQVAAFDAASAEPGTVPVVLVAAQRDLIDAHGKVFVKARGLGRLHGRVRGTDALRSTVIAGGNLFGEPACVLMRRAVFVETGGWQDLDYYLDLGGYAPLLARGDMVALRVALAAFRVGGSQWSVQLVNQQATDAAAFHRIAQRLAPGHITDRDVRVGNARARILAWQRRAAYTFLAWKSRRS